MLDPSLVWEAVYQIAAPLKNIMVASVTMNDGMPKKATQMPLAQPMATPITRIAAQATGTAAGLPAR
jgi:hypothetical protein